MMSRYYAGPSSSRSSMPANNSCMRYEFAGVIRLFPGLENFHNKRPGR